MEVSIPIERTLTQVDYLRLTRLLHPAGAEPLSGTPDLRALEELLAACDLVHPVAVPHDVVTMDTQVLLADGDSGEQQKLTICYPGHADPAAGFVSVLSPVGASLLGLRAGSTACWRNPHGGHGRAEILAVLFQPEASGDYTS